ncbi:DUF6662 family protein [Caldimonas brevitalea]|uniref:Lipoprotein n=1 Tax=Caldimonas brevitalea TaxID=413882 RepID=A0A0G3BJS1_9BURK|nr:DUF6662 family protein [Caldimonas brevitalea]AKJ29637.1 lipoprotein [Caldimonas brevitalea]
MSIRVLAAAAVTLVVAWSAPAVADENLFGYVKGAETLPKGAKELYQWVTVRDDKGTGEYRAIDSKTEFEYGVTDRFQAAIALNALAVDTSGLLIDGYLPQEKDTGLRLSGLEASFKYNFMSPAKEDVGLSGYATLGYGRLDRHSGQRKSEYEVETGLLAQKYFLEGQLTWVANVGVRAGYADRKAIEGLSEDIEWPTDPEMEISTKIGTGLAYRFAPSWYVGAELLHEIEYETEVGKERWSLFGGPTLHYGGQRWWASLTWFQQLRGGGEKYEGQRQDDLHLIEKTRREVRLKVGYNF